MNTRDDAIRDIVRVTKKRLGELGLRSRDVAKELGVGPSWIHLVVMGELGIGFRPLLTALRVERAKEVTLSGEARTWKQVALRAGFNDQKYFGRVFKEIVGETWGQWRDRQEQERRLKNGE